MKDYLNQLEQLYSKEYITGIVLLIKNFHGTKKKIVLTLSNIEELNALKGAR